jgi:alpha-L-glutamate ligase-like protein
MAVSKRILGMNARNFLYVNKYNTKRAKQIADDKLETKRVLLAAGIPTANLFATFSSPRAIRRFNWKSVSGDFVLKPARGYGGEGIMVVRNWNGVEGVSLHGVGITIHAIESKIFDILDGAYSLDNLPDRAFLEERVIVQNSFHKISAGGVPDIRIIVCHRVPIMAMLRLPTYESGGRANLHMGALGIGIDLRTGITTKCILHDANLIYIPGTNKTKAHGIKIPFWDELLKIAVRAQEVSLLGYAGVDIVIDETRGSLVLEVNARPGLTIQLANGESLRTRLERVAGLDIKTAEKGIDLARELFAEPVLSVVPTGNNILHVIEKIQIIGPTNKRKTVFAKIDTGAYRTALDESLVRELELTKHPENVIVKAGVGTHERHTAYVLLKIRGKEIKTVASYLNRKHMQFPVIVGRRDLNGFLVDPSRDVTNN